MISSYIFLRKEKEKRICKEILNYWNVLNIFLNKPVVHAWEATGHACQVNHEYPTQFMKNGGPNACFE